MSIYLKNGYVDIERILNYRIPFNFIIGGRGTGKTYGALKYAYENDIRFMLMRRKYISPMRMMMRLQISSYTRFLGTVVL